MVRETHCACHLGYEKLQSRMRTEMIPAILFTVSTVALIQFGVYYWRAVIAGVASKTVSDRIRAAAGLTHLHDRRSGLP